MAELTIQSDLDIDEIRTRCGQFRDMLAELANIHLEIDTPTRIMDANEPDWIGRLRKICLHVRAIDRWEIGVGVEHVMAPEIRAAFEQMSVVWKCLPPDSRLEKEDGNWWDDEARNGILATYDHPTSQSLMLSAEHGGFNVDESGMVYARLALWLGYLAFGYALAINHLSQILERGVDIESRITAMLNRMTELTTLKEINKIADVIKKEHTGQSRPYSDT